MVARAQRDQPSGVNAQTGIALVLTLVSACAINWGYLTEHRAASALPSLSPRQPLRSLRLLLGSRLWLLGFASESAGFGLYVVAVALAPLALVQAVAAGGIGVLALLVARTTGTRLEPRERLGVTVAIGGLALLGASLAGGSEQGESGSWLGVALWLGASAAVAVALISSALAQARGGAAALGLAAGVLFAGGDVATKVAVSGGAHLAVGPAMIAFYALGTVVLQMGFQRGRALTTAGIATLGTNAIPIVAAMTLFAEPLPSGVAGMVRVAAFVAVVIGAVALAPKRERPVEEPSAPSSPRVRLPVGMPFHRLDPARPAGSHPAPVEERGHEHGAADGEQRITAREVHDERECDRHGAEQVRRGEQPGAAASREARHREQAGQEADEHRDRVDEHQLLLLPAGREDDRRGDQRVDQDGRDGRVVAVGATECGRQ